MLKLKYILVNQSGLEVPIIFPAVLEHVCVAAGRPVISAGFVDIIADETAKRGFTVRCHGRSTSLNLDSREEDREWVQEALNVQMR